MVIQVLNSKLGITLCVSVTCATIITAKRTMHKNFFLLLDQILYSSFITLHVP